MAWQCISPEVTVKDFRKCYTSNAVNGTNNMLWNDSEGWGLEWMWGRWKFWLWSWKQWHWLVQVDTIWHALCIKCESNKKISFDSRHFIFRGHLRFGWIHFPLADVFFCQGHLRLESPCIWVTMVFYTFPHTHLCILIILSGIYVTLKYPNFKKGHKWSCIK